jgi:hypothetical protein
LLARTLTEPTCDPHLNHALFVTFFCVILSMYGGGFATVPAYLADMFSAQFVGAIHGRLLTAWSTAGVLGPVLVSYMREATISAGVERSSVYEVTLYLLAGLLVIGLIANLLVRPVAPKWFMSDAEIAAVQVEVGAVAPSRSSAASGLSLASVLAWGARSHPYPVGCLDHTHKGRGAVSLTAVFLFRVACGSSQPIEALGSLSVVGRYGLMSSSGVPSTQSRYRTFSASEPSKPSNATIESPIGFGRNGARVENTPRGWESNGGVKVSFSCAA